MALQLYCNPNIIEFLSLTLYCISYHSQHKYNGRYIILLNNNHDYLLLLMQTAMIQSQAGNYHST